MPRQGRDPEELRKAVGRRVASVRRRLSLTQVQLAQAVGVDSQTISKIERGLQTPTGTTLRGLADVLRVSSSFLLGEGDLDTDEAAPLDSVEASDLTHQGRQVIEEYLGSTHGRSAPRSVKAQLRAGLVFASLGVRSPGWRDVDDLRNILERQSSKEAAGRSTLLTRDRTRKSGDGYSAQGRVEARAVREKKRRAKRR